MQKNETYTENEEKKAVYRTLVSQKLVSTLKSKIEKIIFKKKKYKDKNYSVRRLAEELGTNTRYVAATIRLSYDMNYTSLINKCRVEEAMEILANERGADLNVDEVSNIVGFSNRQTFYAAFRKFVGTTPRKYREDHLRRAIGTEKNDTGNDEK